MRVCTVSALVLFTVSLAKCQVSMSGSDWDSLFGSAKENAPHKSSSSRNRNRYQHGSKSESPWAQIDPITREPLLQPRIDVQSVLAEGIGWKASMGHETAHHVVITITGVDPDTKSQIAFKNAPIAVKVDWSAAEKRASKPLKCVIETGDGSGKFSRCDLSARPRTLYTNDLGRVSFSLPIPGAFPLKESSHTIGIPALLIQTSFMEDGSWYDFACSLKHCDTHLTHMQKDCCPYRRRLSSQTLQHHSRTA